jgi:hypothetical protein
MARSFRIRLTKAFPTYLDPFVLSLSKDEGARHLVVRQAHHERGFVRPEPERI